MADSPTKESIVAALRGVIDPVSKRDIGTAGYVRNIACCDGVCRISFQAPSNIAGEDWQRSVTDQTRSILLAMPGMREVTVEYSIVQPRATNTLPGVKHVIAVGAGKGGVGKSTVAILAAVGLMRRGFRAGLLDADVYGPSLPKLTGTERQQPTPDPQGRIIPPVINGLKVMSMGHIIAPDQAIVWRGPMAQKYVKEFLDRGNWGELDYLIVDLPPGTGDIPLTLAQSIPLAGAVVVCTPQDVALLDAVKALRMYEKLGVDTLGVVENMSYYLCPHCGHRDEIFSHGGAKQAAAELGVPFLGEIPLNIALRQHGDAGRPFANFDEVDNYVSEALETLIDRLIAEIETKTRQRTPLPQLRVTD